MNHDEKHRICSRDTASTHKRNNTPRYVLLKLAKNSELYMYE